MRDQLVRLADGETEWRRAPSESPTQFEERVLADLKEIAASDAEQIAADE